MKPIVVLVGLSISNKSSLSKVKISNRRSINCPAKQKAKIFVKALA